jgi:cadmium resistance protein CadD (predicted permease)
MQATEIAFAVEARAVVSTASSSDVQGHTGTGAMAARCAAAIPVVVVSIITLFSGLDNTITAESEFAVVATVCCVFVSIIAFFALITVCAVVATEVAGVAALHNGTTPPHGS